MNQGLIFGGINLESNILKRLDKLTGKGSHRLINPKQGFSFKDALHDRTLLGKLRNSLVAFFLMMVLFKIGAYIAGIYLTGYEFASFIAYFSFFLLVAGGLFLSIYFPMKYGGEEASFSIKLPKISIPNLGKGKSSSKSEKELNSMLKSERKNLMNAVKEKESFQIKLKNSERECEKLRKEKKEIEKKASEQPKKTGASGLGLLGSLLRKKEVVRKDRGVKTEMPKIKITAKHKSLAKKYRSIPKQQQQRVELYRGIARSVQSEDGSFSISQIMEALLEMFKDEVDRDRRKLLEEIEGWVNEDAYTPLIRTEKGIKYHRIIK